MESLKNTRTHPLLPVLAGLMILVSFLTAAGCTGNTAVPGNIPLNGSSWTLAAYTQNGTSMPALNGTTVTLIFDKEGSITGSAGCNHYCASYGLKGSAITIGQAGSTEMYCTAPGIMEQESSYLALLGRAASVSAGDTTLTLADAQGEEILSFARMVPPAPAPLVGTNWTLDSFYSADAVSSVEAGTTITAVFDQVGNVAGSAGCNHYFASYSVTGTMMTLGAPGSTKMYCTGQGIMQQESTYLASLSRAAAFSISGNRLSLSDAKGAVLLSFTREA
jgi:heat shock protein HslJ